MSYIKAFKDGLRPSAKISVSQWADTYRVLPKESSSEAGKWRTSRFPFLKEIMDELSPQSKTQEVILMKGTQIGGTEIGNNFMLCWIDLYPTSMIFMQPTEDLIRKHRANKLLPSIRAMPHIKDKIQRGKTKDDIGDASGLRFIGGFCTYAWSNATSQFRSVSAKVIIADDIDGFPKDVDGEGNPVQLLINRADTFANRKIYVNSTPTTKGDSNIEIEYDDSSQATYYMPCPECKEWVYYHKDFFVFDYDKESYKLKDKVLFSCEHCGSLIDQKYKTWMMDEANGAKWIHKHPDNPRKGYHLPSYYSPLGFLSWEKIFSEFLRAKKKLNEKDNSYMKAWINTRSAQVFEEKFEKIDESVLENRLEEYEASVPSGVIFLTAGVDTQDDRLELEIVGWGKYSESWSIDYFIISGDPAHPNVWDKLDNILQSTFTHELGFEMRIHSTCIDTGGHRGKYVYEYCRPRYELNIFAIKGDKGIDTPLIKNRPSLNNKGKVPLFMIGVNSAKDTVHKQINTQEIGAGYMHFPKKDIYDKTHFKRLASEKRDKDGRWHKFRSRNEALDARVYAMAALEIFIMNYYPVEFDWDSVEDEFLDSISINHNETKKYNNNNNIENNFSDWRDEY